MVAMPLPDEGVMARRSEIASALRCILPAASVIDAAPALRAYESDGLAAYRILSGEAAGLVAPGGRALIKAGAGQAPQISALLAKAGFAVEAPWKDLGGVDRIVSATH